MLLTGLPHHDTGGFTSHRKFLADKEYGEALDTLVKACSDMLLISPTDKIFLGKRKVHALLGEIARKHAVLRAHFFPAIGRCSRSRTGGLLVGACFQARHRPSHAHAS